MKTHSLLPLVLVFAAFACNKEPSKADPTPKNAAPAASATTTTNAAPAASGATTPAGNALSADATGALPLSWKVANAGTDLVSVSLVAGDETIPVGKLSASNDDGPGTVDTCAMKNTGTTASKLECGASPHYNFYTANITGGALVVTLTDGIDPGVDPGAKPKVTEVLRRSTTATSVKASGPASKALFGECRPGYVQKGPGQPCMHQCLKGPALCKATEKCELTAIVGTDGPHKVSACVPK